MAQPVPTVDAQIVNVPIAMEIESRVIPQSTVVIDAAPFTPPTLEEQQQQQQQQQTAGAVDNLNTAATTAGTTLVNGASTLVTGRQQQNVSVTVPIGILPGQMFSFSAPSGKLMSMACPPNAGPGTVLTVPITDSQTVMQRATNAANITAQGLNTAAGQASVNSNNPLGRVPCSNWQCNQCNQIVTTHIDYENGTTVFVAAGVTCFFGCWLGCCLIPFCIQDLKDAKHFCPNCNNYLGKHAKMG